MCDIVPARGVFFIESLARRRKSQRTAKEKGKIPMKKTRGMAWLLVAVLLLGLQAGTVQAESDKAGQMYITGEATVERDPDIAHVRVSVRTEGKVAKEAADANHGKVKAIFEALRELGLEDKDFATEDYSVFPQYHYGRTGKRRFTGYQVQTSVLLKVKDLEHLSEVILRSLAQGGTEIQQLRYDLMDRSEAYGEAVDLAVKASKMKAESLAKAGDLALDPVPVQVRELATMHSEAAPYMYQSDMKEMAAAGAGAPVPLSSSKILVTAKVSASFAYENPVYEHRENMEDGRLLEQSVNVNVVVAPDLALVELGVFSEAAEAPLATQENNEKMQAIFAALKAAGLPEEAMETSHFSVQPRYDYSGDKPRRTGFEVSNSVRLRIEEVERASEFIVLGLDHGANEIRDLRYQLKDDSSYYQDALQKAMGLSKEKAERIAEAGGFRLDPIPLRIEEDGQDVYGVQGSRMTNKIYYMADGEQVGSALPLHANQMVVEARLRVFYSYE